MAEDLPGPPGSGNRDDRPGAQPTEPLGGPAQPPQPSPSSGHPGGDQPPPEPPPDVQQDGYGQQHPGYGYSPGPQTEGMATAALVVAIAGFFVCAPVGAIVALVLANSARQRIEASGGRLSGLEQARAARIIAIIELVLTAIIVLVLAIGGAIAITTSRTGHDEPVQVPTSVSAPRSMIIATASRLTTVASSISNLSTAA